MTREQKSAHERMQAQLTVRTHEGRELQREVKATREKRLRMEKNSRSMNAKRGKAIRIKQMVPLKRKRRL